MKNLRLDLPENSPTYLIGSNNSGKSTVLNAIAFALRGGGFHTFTPEPYDFFLHDAAHAKTFCIDVHLLKSGGDLPAVQGVGSPVDVHRIRVSGRTESGGRLSHRHTLVGADGKNIAISPRTVLKGEVKERYTGHDLGWTKKYARLDDIRVCLPEVWLITAENLERSLYHWKTGPLSKLASLLSSRFLRDEWTFEHEGTSRAMPRTIEKVHDFFRSAVAEFPFWRDELRPQLEEALSGYLGRQATFRLRPDIQTIEEWLTQQLVASFAAETGGAITPLERMGSGWQALVRIAALEVLRQHPETVSERVVMLLEEPETYLHPHLRRKLRDVLQKLADAGWVIVSATHSPEFVKFGTAQQITRLWRTRSDVVSGSLPSKQVERSAQFQERIDEHGNHEFLFANRAIFVEGKDDAFAVRNLLNRLSADLDGRGVSVLAVGGIENLPHYVRMASSLSIPWCVVTDEDADEAGNQNPKTKKVIEVLRQRLTPSDRLFHWRGSLERLLGASAGKATPEWQAANVESLSTADLNEHHADYVAVGNEIDAWTLPNAS